MTVSAVAAMVATTTGAGLPARIRPSIFHDFPDPTVMSVGDTYYAYSTASWYGTKLFHVPVVSSPRLTGGWSQARDAMPALPIWADHTAAGQGSVWAPAVTARDHHDYLLYFTARSASQHTHCIGVARAWAPQGPFHPIGSHPLVCRPADIDAVDPKPFTDTDGRHYLLYSASREGNAPYADIGISAGTELHRATGGSPAGHKTRADHLPLRDLAQPHRVQVGLRATRQVLDIAGVDQPHLQPLSLQQIKHRLPVLRRGLHHHPAHPQTPQMIRQLQQRASHRGIGRHLLAPSPRLTLVRDPYTADQLSLANIQCRHPRDDLLTLRIFLQHNTLPLVVVHRQPAAARRSCQRASESDPRARSTTEQPTGQLPASD